MERREAETKILWGIESVEAVENFERVFEKVRIDTISSSVDDMFEKTFSESYDMVFFETDSSEFLSEIAPYMEDFRQSSPNTFFYFVIRDMDIDTLETASSHSNIIMVSEFFDAASVAFSVMSVVKGRKGGSSHIQGNPFVTFVGNTYYFWNSDIYWDKTKDVLSVYGKEVSLLFKKNIIFLELLLNAERVVSAEELVEKSGMENPVALRVMLSKLRREFGDFFEIISVKGRGYVLKRSALHP